MDDGGGLENHCGASHRGFESLSLRQILLPKGSVLRKVVGLEKCIISEYSGRSHSPVECARLLSG